jgi:hypothetical protein
MKPKRPPDGFAAHDQGEPAKDLTMKTLKTFGLITASALALSATAAPGVAQPWRAPHVAYDRHLTTSYVDSLDWRITNAAQQRRISWGQANALRAQLREVQPIAYRVQTGRASSWEYRRLSRVVDRIESATRGYAMNDRYRPGWRH